MLASGNGKGATELLQKKKKELILHLWEEQISTIVLKVGNED